MANRFEGKNLEEALTAASQTLGVERYQLTYHVLLEKRGFLGGMKRVVIEADINEAATVPIAPAPARAAAGPAAEPRAPRQDRGERRPAGRGREGRSGGGGAR